jgi:hypothetical protein
MQNLFLTVLFVFTAFPVFAGEVCKVDVSLQGSIEQQQFTDYAIEMELYLKDGEIHSVSIERLSHIGNSRGPIVQGLTLDITGLVEGSLEGQETVLIESASFKRENSSLVFLLPNLDSSTCKAELKIGYLAAGEFREGWNTAADAELVVDGKKVNVHDYGVEVSDDCLGVKR